MLPKLKIIYMSGYLEEYKGNLDFLEGAFFLDKPFSRDVLARQVGEALRGEQPRQLVS